MEDSLFNLGPHWGFIVASYGAVLVVLAGLLGWILLDERQLRRTLERFEREGLRRRKPAARRAMDAGAPRSPSHTLTQTGGETAHE